MRRKAFILPVCGLVVAAPLVAGQFHVTPSGSPSGDGSRDRSWDLATALRHPPAVEPGDTIWLHGGTYAGHFISSLTGDSTRPVRLIQYPGEQARIDGGDSQQEDILAVSGSYAWYEGFEIYSSDTVRSTPETGSFPSPSSLGRGTCLGVTQESPTYGNKFINLLIHDGFNGFVAWMPANTELYGCVVYNNGWDAPDRAHGQNVYVQNQLGDRRILEDNIIWGAFDNNVQAYGTQYTDDFYLKGNVVFHTPLDANGVLIGGAQLSENPQLIENCLYEDGRANTLNFGWSGFGGGVNHGTLLGNWIMGGEIEFQPPISNTRVEGNIVYAPYGLVNLSAAGYPDNTWYTERPTAPMVSLRPNAYERGRANITIYNWTLQETVDVDVSSVLTPGTAFRVWSAEDPLGPPVMSGVYGGGSLAVPMSEGTAVSPIGKPGSRTSSRPEFGAFVLTTEGTVTAVHAAGNAGPLAFTLRQNYPNPFNSSTVISYSVPLSGGRDPGGGSVRRPASSRVRLAVYDLLGREVALLVDRKEAPGVYNVRFDAAGLAGGMYFCVLTGGTERLVRRMLYLR